MSCHKRTIISESESESLSCPFCDTIVVDKSALHCDKCDHWVHYTCSKLFNLKNHQGCSRATLVSMNVLKMTFLSFILKLKELLKKKMIPY